MSYKHTLLRVAVTAVCAVSVPGVCSAEDLSLRQALELALKNNPAIAADELSSDAARHSARGARALTNPELTVAPTITGEAGSDADLMFSQPLEINGSRRVRGAIAAREADAASHQAAATRQAILLKVRQTYWDVARAQELVALDQENVNYLQELNRVAQRQLDVGSIPTSQLLKTEVELARARQELAATQLVLAQSRAELNALLNRPKSMSFSTADELDVTSISVDREALTAASLKQRPELAGSQAELAAAKQEVKAARLRRSPDLALQARKEDWDGDGGVAVALSLPIFDWGSVRQDTRRAQAAAKSREKQLEATANDVALDVEQAIQSYETASAIVREYQDGIMDKSQQLAEMARKGYERGATSYLEVLEAQRTLRSTKTAYLSALADHAKSVAQIEWATGARLDDSTSATPPQPSPKEGGSNGIPEEKE